MTSSGKSSVLLAWNCSFVRRGFRRKVPFFGSTKLENPYYGVEVEQNVITVITPPHPPTPPKYQDAKISTRAWPLTGVDTINTNNFVPCVKVYFKLIIDIFTWKAEKNLVIVGKRRNDQLFSYIKYWFYMTKNIVKSKEHCSPTRSKTVVARHFVEEKPQKALSNSHTNLPIAKPYFFDKICFKKKRSNSSTSGSRRSKP